MEARVRCEMWDLGCEMGVLINLQPFDYVPFDEPDTFDIHRPNAHKHVSFAYGPHFCFGGPLARLQGEVGISILFGRLSTLGLHPDYPTAPYGHEFRSTPTLFVTW